MFVEISASVGNEIGRDPRRGPFRLGRLSARTPAEVVADRAAVDAAQEVADLDSGSPHLVEAARDLHTAEQDRALGALDLRADVGH